MLPLLVAAMAFLAALALAAAVGAASLARHWQEGAAAALTIQVPHPGASAAAGAESQSGAAAHPSRLDRVMAILRDTPAISHARPLTDTELADLLRPWLGDAAEALSLPLPAVIEIHVSGDGPDLANLVARLQDAVPGTLVENHGVWVQRLSMLAGSLQACAWVALLVVAAVAAAVIGVATRTGLVARREAIEIVHGLGATDDYIAARFANRATRLAGIGGGAGALAALPVLLMLSGIAAPFLGAPNADPAGVFHRVEAWLGTLPLALWLALPVLPLSAAAIGFVTAHGTVRRWLRRLP
jgi:cell division transport system permease protein